MTLSAEKATDAATARRFVDVYLTDEGFCAHAGRWGRGIADWFVIGGRWSGALSRHSWAREVTAQMAALEAQHDVQVWGAFYGDPAKQRVQQELACQFQQLWDAHAPAAYKGIPIQRDPYTQYGYADDAMLLTQELYDALLKEHEGQEESDAHADVEWEPIDPAMIGKKWLVVVDYHS